MKIIRTACVQMTSGADIDANLKTADYFIREAAEQGATFIATPEMTDSIMRYTRDKLASTSDKSLQHFSNLAKELNIWLLAGSFGVKTSQDKLANRSMLFAPDGSCRAHYDKIHMFDVTLSRKEFYRESSDYEAGDKAVIVDCNDFKVGMGVCYDLRFPHLWRDLAKAGANILTAPAAFTVPTGGAHWEVLLRARAIETGCFVIAPAQIGEHYEGRETYGHSMIISPWGEILANAQDSQGIIIADLDMEAVEKSRKSIPALAHDRTYTLNIIHDKE
ncbi:MAG: carbon-nitrogen hydrolase family protein [Bdellovibrionales bacterium]